MIAPEDGAEGYEIVFGGWGNTQSVLRDGKQKPHPGYSVTRVNIIKRHIVINLIHLFGQGSLLSQNQVLDQYSNH